jgi:hypothetical protein
MSNLDDIKFSPNFVEFVLQTAKGISAEIAALNPNTTPPNPNEITNRFLAGIEEACLMDRDRQEQLSTWFYIGEMDKCELHITKMVSQHILKFLSPPLVYDPLTLYYLFKNITVDPLNAYKYLTEVRGLHDSLFRG